MRCFFKYFLIVFALQVLFAGFVFASAYVFGSAIGDGVLFVLYALPWLLILAGQQKTGQNFSEVYLVIAFLVPSVVYSSILSVGVCLISRRIQGKSNSLAISD